MGIRAPAQVGRSHAQVVFAASENHGHFSCQPELYITDVPSNTVRENHG